MTEYQFVDDLYKEVVVLASSDAAALLLAEKWISEGDNVGNCVVQIYRAQLDDEGYNCWEFVDDLLVFVPPPVPACSVGSAPRERLRPAPATRSARRAGRVSPRASTAPPRTAR